MNVTAGPGHVGLIALGGTIAMRPAPGGGVIAGLDAADLLATAGTLDTQVRILEGDPVPSAGLSFVDLLAVVADARAAVDAGAIGIVLTQGTDTLEETAFLVDSVWDRDAPVVVTGAMRNPTQPGADGPANLRAAVQVAADSAARERGALVVFADQIHAARHVRKTHSTSLGTFVSPDLGPIGYLAEERPHLLATLPRRHPITGWDERSVADTHVALFTAVLDEHVGALTALVDGPPTLQGLIVAGFGAGHVPPALVPDLARAADAVPVVLTSRTGSGPALAATYAAPGSERDLLGRGLISGGLVHPYKARVLLRLLVAGGASRDAIALAFRDLS